MAKGLCGCVVVLLLAMVLQAEACKRDQLQKAVMDCGKQEMGDKPPDDKEKAKKMVCCAFLTAEKCMRDALKSTSCESEESTLNAALMPFSMALTQSGVDCKTIEVDKCGASATAVALWLLMLAPLVGRYLH